MSSTVIVNRKTVVCAEDTEFDEMLSATSSVVTARVASTGEALDNSRDKVSFALWTAPALPSNPFESGVGSHIV